MKVVGLITEYNPFHKGHLYHLEKSKFLTKSEYSISIMSGNFLQRGEPAMLDKWHRAKMAVQNGVDLVVELPFAYACQSAELFAYGAVKLLDSTNSIDCIAFGSEAGETEHLESISSVLIEEPKEYRDLLKSYLTTGLSYPKSREKALIDYFESQGKRGLVEPIVSCSNNILGIEYIKALKKLDSSIEPVTIKRVSSQYNDQNLKNEISSATAIRSTYFNTKDILSIKKAIPIQSFEVMKSFLNENLNFNQLENFSDILFYIMIMEKEILRDVLDIDKDLANRMLKNLGSADNLSEFLKTIKTKRYTMTRLQRCIIHLIMKLYESDVKKYLSLDSPYLRVLASNKKGFEILNKIKSNSSIKIVNKMSDVKFLSDDALKMLELDIKATDVYYLGLNKHSKILHYRLDYTKSPYIEK